MNCKTGLLVIILTLVLTPCAGARQYYVSSTGSDDTGSGTFNNPWGTVAYGLRDLEPGDTLYLREGVYYESDILLVKKGTHDAPITIRSYPGEKAVIDGAEQQYSTSPNSDWELVDSFLKLYRSTRTYSGEFAGAWLLDDNINLVQYSSSANMDSTNYGPLNGNDPIYIGPGLQLRDDGHIYIRLKMNPNDQTDHNGNHMPALPAISNPRLNRIAVYTADQLVVTSGAEHVILDHIGFRHSDTAIDLRDDTRNLIIRDCNIKHGQYGVLVRDARDCTIARCDFDNGMPHYVYWTDVKGGGQDVAEAYPEFQSMAINGNLSGFTISYCTISNTMDGIGVREGSTGTRVMHNTFYNTRDDAIDVLRNVWDVEIGFNMLHRTMLGISILPHDQAGGEVYIHHNVIDSTGYHRSGRVGSWRDDRYPVWAAGTPFGSHDEGSTEAKWKIYNNTFVARKGRIGHFAFGPNVVDGSIQKQVRNNIFFALDDRICCASELASEGTEYNGNVYWRNAPAILPMFVGWGSVGAFHSLAEFRDQSGTSWETAGLEIDPGFDVADIDEGIFEPLEMLGRYRPSENLIYTEGVSYDDVDWPCTDDVNYRGAVGRTFQRRTFQLPPN